MPVVDGVVIDVDSLPPASGVGHGKDDPIGGPPPPLLEPDDLGRTSTTLAKKKTKKMTLRDTGVGHLAKALTTDFAEHDPAGESRCELIQELVGNDDWGPSHSEMVAFSNADGHCPCLSWMSRS